MTENSNEQIIENDSNEETITLVSSDQKNFQIPKSAALLSGTIKTMLTGPGNFKEQQTGIINLPKIRGEILAKVVEYLLYKFKYEDTPERPEFKVETETALELLMAAHYLEV
ncbi:elongin-c [Anaeramoeba ignava]|uniref:Elongin-C n=1 Tax=Anaeramoeba ignava TaxID=1746090 RepID=A0A9Q0R826_ANAIG|nr:elongin-c [Anaeramoeba ignava]|eukprot:Anaeramoba_ignava/a89852_693.p2 GENE.a89852_693~~a89852_693.p2  ORF type:complete len:112 (-),score=44.66 a89852_693:2766-3101(-)